MKKKWAWLVGILLVVVGAGAALLAPRELAFEAGAAVTEADLRSGSLPVTVVMTRPSQESSRIEVEVFVDGEPAGRFESRLVDENGEEVAPVRYHYFWFDGDLWPDLTLVSAARPNDSYIVESGSGRLVHRLEIGNWRGQ